MLPSPCGGSLLEFLGLMGNAEGSTLMPDQMHALRVPHHPVLIAVNRLAARAGLFHSSCTHAEEGDQ